MTNDEDRSLDELLATLDRDPPPPRAGLAQELVQRLRSSAAGAEGEGANDAKSRRPILLRRGTWLAAAGLLIGATLVLWRPTPPSSRTVAPEPTLAALIEETRRLEKDLQSIDQDRLERCLALARQSFEALENARTRSPSTEAPDSAEHTTRLGSMAERERIGLERLVWLQSTRPEVVGAETLRARGLEIAEQYSGTWIADMARRFAADLPH